MKPRTWMPLYIADYLKKTSHLRALESGAYLHLIMAYWVGGGLPTDDRQLATIAKVSDKEWKAIKPTLAAFFGPNWTHARVEEEMAKADEVAATTSERARHAANKRWSKQSSSNANGNAPGIAGAVLEDMLGDAPSPSQRKKDKTELRSAATEDVPKYAFEGVIIKLSKRHFADWVRAFEHLDLRAELVARDAWLASDRATDADKKSWFISTSKYLANRNMEAKNKVTALRPEPQRGIAGII